MNRNIIFFSILLFTSLPVIAESVDSESDNLISKVEKCNTIFKNADKQLVNECFEKLLNQADINQHDLFYINLLSNYAYSLILTKQFSNSIKILNKSINIAKNTGHSHLLPHMSGNLAIAHIHLKQYKTAFNIINNVYFTDMKDNNTKTQIQIQYINILIKLLDQTNLNKKDIAQNILHHTDSILHNKYIAPIYTSKTLIKKAYLYQYNNQLKDAEILLQKALNLSQQYGYSRQVLLSQWNLARLYKKMGKQIQSIDYYAMSTAELKNSNINLSTISNDLLLNTQPVSALYYEYANTLLAVTPNVTDNKRKQKLLQIARQAIESSKAVDLQDYFKDDCVANTRQKIQKIDNVLSKDSAILYPIAFENRLELLLSTNKGITQYTKIISKNTLINLASELRTHIEKRKSRSYLKPAKQLYELIISPIEKQLIENNITTLITIPSHGLHGLVFSTLHDGNKFLIEKIALAISPGLELTDPRILPHSNTNILLSGLTEPVQGYPALNHVHNELFNINKHYQSDILINNNFNTRTFSNALLKKRLTIAHIATHGEFGNSVDESFILAHDKKISVNQLSEYIGFNRFRDTPLELLTLSACYTAAGNDRAALGLAGITVKSGARSALATLWPVNDKATTILMGNFYRNLESNLGKAQSLRQAQLSLISDIQYRHPGYWAPFILIGNWQ